jgi:hypothetical protein
MENKEVRKSLKRIRIDTQKWIKDMDRQVAKAKKHWK